MDETWLYLYEPDAKQQSRLWKYPQSPPPKKKRRRAVIQKVYVHVLHGIQREQHAVPQGTTMKTA